MSKMLLAYAYCGCLVQALLDADDPTAHEFRTESALEGFVVKEEERAEIGAETCEFHKAQRDAQ